MWRAVAVPSEHGGWGLTLEPVLLGLVVASSWSGFAIGLAAFLAFLARTPLKLAAVDRRKHRSLPRTRFAIRVAVVELSVLCLLAMAAVWTAGVAWLVPALVAAPLVAVQSWFDVRSRSRRLAPELAGAVGITAVTASILVAGGGDAQLAMGLWMVLAARAVASIPFVRTQIDRLRHGNVSLATTDLFQLAGTAIAGAAIVVDGRATLGAVAVAVIAVAQAIATRRSHIPPAKAIGVRQMIAGLVVVASCAVGAHL